MNTSGAVVENYNYDGYGNAHGFEPADAATNLLYAGEQFDTHLAWYYNRARYYNPATGRFNRLDPFSGNNFDPQSLHKYLYAHCNPVNATDPSGLMSLISTMTTISIISSVISIFLPVVGGVVVAVKSGISPWEYIGELASLTTWREALFAVGLGGVSSWVLLKISAKIGAKIFSVVGAVISIYSMLNSIKLTVDMATGNVSRRDIAHYLALTTAVIILSVLIGKMIRSGPGSLPGSGEPPSSTGIYEFKGSTGKIYVGRSKNLFRRMQQNIRSGKLPPENVKTLRWRRIEGASIDDLRIAEQLRIEAHGGVRNLENIINSIAAKNKGNFGI